MKEIIYCKSFPIARVLLFCKKILESWSGEKGITFLFAFGVESSGFVIDSTKVVRE